MTQNSTTSPVSRRTVVKGAAWTVPAIAAAVAVPAASASPNILNVITGTRRCTLAGIANPPLFTISSTGLPVPVGTTFTITYGAGVFATLDLEDGVGAGFELLTANSNSLTFTVTQAIPVGTVRDVEFIGSGVAIGVNRNAILSLASLPAGFSDENPADNSIRMSWTGIRGVVLTLFSCSDNRP